MVEPDVLPDPVLVRRATAGDLARIRTLALLDDRRLDDGPYLIAEVADEAVAAMAMPSGQIVADPFRRTRDAEDLLRLRAGQIAARERAAARTGERTALKPATAA